MAKSKPKSLHQLRDEAVKILYESLNKNYVISLEECYEIYDKMQEVNRSGSDSISTPPRY